MTLGERIRKRRLELRLRRGDLADATSISYTQIARYESDDSLPTAEVIVGLANVLQVSTDWLLGNTQIEAPEQPLTDLEEEVLRVFRTQPREEQAIMIELLKVATKFTFH